MLPCPYCAERAEARTRIDGGIEDRDPNAGRTFQLDGDDGPQPHPEWPVRVRLKDAVMDRMPKPGHGRVLHPDAVGRVGGTQPDVLSLFVWKGVDHRRALFKSD